MLSVCIQALSRCIPSALCTLPMYCAEQTSTVQLKTGRQSGMNGRQCFQYAYKYCIPSAVCTSPANNRCQEGYKCNIANIHVERHVQSSAA